MKALKLSFLLLVFFLCIATAGAQPIPALPHTLNGNVYIDGNPAPAGTLITARVGEETLTESRTATEGASAIGIEKPEKQGETARLYVNGIDTGKEVTLKSGAVDTLNLSVSSLSNPWFWVIPLVIAVAVIIIIILKYGKKQR